MTAATHNGTCQACGRQQADRAFGLAHHGYHTSFGYFQGVCRGAKRPPLEVSHDLCDRIVESLRDEVAGLSRGTTVETVLLAGGVQASYRNGSYPNAPLVRIVLTSEAAFDALSDVVKMHLTRSYYAHGQSTWVAMAKDQAWSNECRAKGLAGHADMLEERKAARFGAELVAR